MMVNFITNKIPPSLTKAGIVFALVSIISLVGIFASYMYLDDTNQAQFSAGRTTRLWQSRINTSVKNNQIIDESENNFIKLVNQGVMGKEDRLNWFETIQNTADKRGMPSVRYSISRQVKLDRDNIKRDFPGIDVFKSTMTLNMKIGHEGDLFALLNSLEKAKGLFVVDHCNIERVNRKASAMINNMQAYCKLGWYTFKSSKLDAGKQGEN